MVSMPYLALLFSLTGVSLSLNVLVIHVFLIGRLASALLFNSATYVRLSSRLLLEDVGEFTDR